MYKQNRACYVIGVSKNFWKKLKDKSDSLQRPIIVLAPMADVTDSAFRRIIAKYSKMGTDESVLDCMWTEFVSADGLCHDEARKKLLIDLSYTEAERPIVAQIFTSKPENMREAASLCAKLGFNGVDINMGCPDWSIEKQGCGASLIKNPELAKKLIVAAKDGVRQAGSDIPISVKTRIGYSKNELSTWLPALLSENPAVVTIHARTRKELSLVPARWEHIKEAVSIRDGLGSETLIFGNGDILTTQDAFAKAKETGADGVMIGKGIFGTPDLFLSNPDIKYKDESEKEKIVRRLSIMVEHTKLFEELLGEYKSFAIMKKHYKAYVNGFNGAKELRVELMEAKDSKEIERSVDNFVSNLQV